MSHHKLEFRNVSYAYPGGQSALTEVSLTVHHGESVGIIGANGAGKSTLLMLLTGVLTPASGEILVGDVPMTKKTLPDIRQRLGMVFQNTDDQLFMNTVYDDVAFGPRNARLDEATVHQRVMQALETVGIAHLKDRPPFRLSGGEKRAAAIATVLSMVPDVLIMDEPSAALDPRSRRRLIHLLNGFAHTRVITSHDLDMVLETCSRVIVMNEGRVVADGPAGDILRDEALLETCHLELPLVWQKCPVCSDKKE